MTFASVRKTVAAVVTQALGWSAVVIASDSVAITATEWQLGGVALATALGVYLIENTPASPLPDPGDA